MTATDWVEITGDSLLQGTGVTTYQRRVSEPLEQERVTDTHQCVGAAGALNHSLVPSKSENIFFLYFMNFNLRDNFTLLSLDHSDNIYSGSLSMTRYPEAAHSLPTLQQLL